MEGEPVPEQEYKSCDSDKIELTTFSLDQFDNKGVINAKQVQKEEVDNYLNNLWSSDAGLMGDIVDKMEEKERLKFEAV